MWTEIKPEAKRRSLQLGGKTVENMENAPGRSSWSDGDPRLRRRRCFVCSTLAVGLCRSLAFAVLLTSGVRLHAGEHPVPLEKNVDAAKCLECHEDKTKAAHV